MLKFKVIVAAVISILPLNALRILGYRLLGYSISGRIGLGTVIGVSAARIDDARIGAFNWLVGPISVEIRKGAVIGNRNVFTCGLWTADSKFRESNYGRSLRVGSNTLITTGHYLDLAGSFELGDNSWLAGAGSQFWTHGARVEDRDIVIGRDCYIGSAVRFAPGSAVGNNVIVAMGSVVTRKFPDDDAMIGGVPAQVLKRGYDWRKRGETAA